MPLQFLFDENLPGRFLRAVERHNVLGSEPLDIIRVGDTEDLPLGTDDPSILVFAEQIQRIIVSEDKKSMPGHLATHLKSGNHSPGVFIVRRSASLPEVLEFLVLAAYVSEPEEWLDRIEFIP